MPKAEQGTFKAWLDNQPGAKHELIVVGQVECPTTGWTVSLSEAHPQGINPTILILDLESVKPTGLAGQMITHMPVRFEKAGGAGVSKVMIRGGNPDFDVDVGVAE